MKNSNLLHILCVTFSFSFLISACTKEQDFARQIDPDKLNALNSSLSGPVVCGFGGGSGGSNNPNRGIVGDVLYMTPVSNIKPNGNNINLLSNYFYSQGGTVNSQLQTSRYNPCDSYSNPIGRVLFTTDFIENAHFGPLPTCNGLLQPNSYVDVLKGTSQLFMKDISVPAMSFDSGFPIVTSSGQNDFLRNPSGEKLVEFFSLRMKARLTLKDLPANTYPEGVYYFAIYSDDGSMLYFNQNGTYVTGINFDGYHSPDTGYSENGFALSRTAYLEFKLNYFQGPRTNVALTLKWKKPGSTTFETIPSEAYYLPEGVTNPCQ